MKFRSSQFSVVISYVAIAMAICTATTFAGDVRLAIAEIMSNDVLCNNIAAVRLEARGLTTEFRYVYLRDWVLPSKNHANFRLAALQTPTDPVVPMIDDGPLDSERQPAGSRHNAIRIHTGGQLVSPAFDLIAVAKELGKLDELRFAVQSASARGEVQQRCQLSMLAMLGMAKRDLGSAQTAAEQLYERFRKQRFPNLQDRMPETLFAWAAVQNGVLLDDAWGFLISIQDAQIRTGHNQGPLEWNRLIGNLIGRIEYQKRPPSDHAQPFGFPPDLKTWHWTTRIQSWGNGQGIPTGHLQLSNGAVETVANMDDEFLFFTSPLRGNYTLECDCTGFGWKEIFPVVNGTWITPTHAHDGVTVGELYRIVRQDLVDPKLSRVDDWIHFRVDVRDGVCTRYINSRKVCEEMLPAEHDPWLAFRNQGGGNGRVLNVRITGQPVVPDQVNLSELRTSSWDNADATLTATNATHPITHLHGWTSWDEDPWYPEKITWQLEEAQSPDSPPATLIIGRHKPELEGSGGERLLRYHWPIVWDSEITYDFFYREGESLVHPAIGRRALIFGKGKADVTNHWITNAIWDATTLDPLNVSASGNRVSSAALPFKANAWNQMTLRIKGDELGLSLNGIPIFAGDIEPTNDRTFGLFYYCDQTEARVRNVVLKGDWPTTLPPVLNQELRDTDTDGLDREHAALADSFEFDFTNTTEEELQSRFVIADGKRQPVRIQQVVDGKLISSYQQSKSSDWDVFLNPDGLHMRGEAAPKQGSTSFVGPRILISGDFDVIAEFADLQLTPSDNGLGAIYLGPRVIRKDSEAHLLFRGLVQHPDTPLRHLAQVEISESGKNGFRYLYPFIKTEECTSGRLRIARRADKFFYLIACLDSDQFHLLHSRDTTDIPSLPGNFLLRTSCYSQGTLPARVSVVWKSVSIRAGSISTVFDLAAASQPVTEQNLREKVDFSD